MEKLIVVLDLDEVLVHSYHIIVKNYEKRLFQIALNKKVPKKYIVKKYGAYMRKKDKLGVKEVQVKFVRRPGVENFLSELSKLDLNVVFWTAGEKLYADCVLDTILPKNLKNNLRLYRKDCRVGNEEKGKKSYFKILSDKFTENELKKLVIVDDNKNNFKSFQENAILAVKWEGIGSEEPVDYLESILSSIKILINVKDVTKVLPGIQKDLNIITESAQKIEDIEKKKRKSFPGFFKKKQLLPKTKLKEKISA
eukprot:snap_masked-scaffold_28-processed-gene-1.20-mRNA-1 protein AED:1.00 eAED:1.00 QI:0/-1/0/0/-1/1/1/0/252